MERLPGWRQMLDSSFLGVQSQHYVARLAERWCVAARQYLNNEDSMILVRYEDFNASKQSTIEGLVRALGLSVANDIGSSVDRQFQPRGNRSVTWQEFFGEHNLRMVNEICAPLLPRFGYASG